jgi:hypothetical protein
MPIRLRMTDALRASIVSILGQKHGGIAPSDRALLAESVVPGHDGTVALKSLEALERCLQSLALSSSSSSSSSSSPNPTPPPSLRQLLKGSAIEFSSPKASVGADPSQVRRKAALLRRKEQREYDRMVENVDPKQRTTLAIRRGAAVSVKRASYGAHILLGMFLGFGAGYMLAKSVYGGSDTVQFVGGIFGMVGTLMLEVTLYIVREEKVRRIKQRGDGKAPPTI